MMYIVVGRESPGCADGRSKRYVGVYIKNSKMKL